MGHEMTAFVRNSEKLYERQGERAEQVKVVADDILNPVSVAEALSHQVAATIAAGHAGQGEEFVRLVDNIISQCEITLPLSVPKTIKDPRPSEEKGRARLSKRDSAVTKEPKGRW
mgnify:FL=1